MATPTLPEIQAAAQAGFRIVKTSNGYVYKPYLTKCMCDFKGEIKKNLRVLDEQNAIHRYEWYNLPPGLTGELLERMLYFKGQLAFFYLEDVGRFYCLPYGLSGDTDVYGRYLEIVPLVFNGGKKGGDGKGADKPFVTGFTRRPLYEVPGYDADLLKAMSEGAVLIKDYTPQLSETIIPRAVLIDGVLEMMSECLPMARTALISASGVKGMRVGSDDEADEVREASQAVFESALTGNQYVPVKGMQEFQELGDGSALKVEDFLLDMQALDNFRLSLHGLDSGGLFQKKSHMLEGEQEMNESRSRAALQDGLSLRQAACDIINGTWGIGVSVEISETASGMDKNGDGLADDSETMSEAPLAEGGEPDEQDAQ